MKVKQLSSLRFFKPYKKKKPRRLKCFFSYETSSYNQRNTFFLYTFPIEILTVQNFEEEMELEIHFPSS